MNESDGDRVWNSPGAVELHQDASSSRVGQPARNRRLCAGQSLRMSRMERWMEIAHSTLVTGTVASLTSTAVLALLARTEGKGALQPTNATSHWLHGDSAACRREPDAAHTLVGYGTHHASALFWALPFETWLASRPPRSSAELLGKACVISAIAAAVDYGATPKRFTPGWELVLSKRSLLAAYGAMALGLAAGAVLGRRGQ